MTNPTSNFGWQMPTPTDLVTDLPADFEVFGQAVDTSLADLKGGTTGQVLAKASNTNMDFVWSTDASGIPASAFTAKGVILVGTGTSTYTGQTVGANGTVLTANSAQADGVEWVVPSGGAGNITQIATGTCSGASVSISGLSSYTNLYLMISDLTNATSSGRLYFRINSNSGSNYVQTTSTFPQTGNYNWYGNYTDTQGWLAGTFAMDRTTTGSAQFLSLSNCKNPGFTSYQVQSAYFTSPGAANNVENTDGIYKVAETVSSISFFNVGGNFTTGTYTLWGA